MTEEYFYITDIKKVMSRESFYQYIKGHDIEKYRDAHKMLYNKNDIISIFKIKKNVAFKDFENLKGVDFNDNWTRN